MLWILLAGCNWGSPDSKPTDVPPVPPTPPVPAGPALPPPPRAGIGEASMPPSLTAPTSLQESSGAATVDVWFDPDRTTFEDLGRQLDAWGLTRVDGDGEVWRVRATDAPYLSSRLAAAPGVRLARDTITPERLPDGATREGSAMFGGQTWSFRQADGPEQGSFAAGDPVPTPALPRALPSGALHCLTPLLEDLQAGEVRGPGWLRGLSTTPRAWGVVVEHYGACDASGWMLLQPTAAVDSLKFGGRGVAEADDPWFADLAVKWVAVPRAADDPQLLAAVALLAQAPDTTLAHAMRDAAPGPAQSQLFEAFVARDSEAAMAVAAGASSPALHAQAVGQDEELRAAVLADPKAAAADVYAALARRRPGPKDPPGLLDRLLASPDPRVRSRAQELRAAASAAACGERSAADLDKDAATKLYEECPQPPVRTAALARVRSLDVAAADALVAHTLEAPETTAAGLAAVHAAMGAGRKDLLIGVIDRTGVARAVRREALTLLVRAGAPEAAALVEKHGAFLGYKGTVPGVPTAANRPAGVPAGAPVGGGR